jgi:hypothetical protein
MFHGSQGHGITETALLGNHKGGDVQNKEAAIARGPIDPG